MWKSAKIKHGSKLQSPARQSISRNEGLIDRYWDKYLPPEEDAADESNPFLRARTPDWSVKRQTQRPQSAMMYTNGFQRPFRPLEVPKNVWKTKKEQEQEKQNWFPDTKPADPQARINWIFAHQETEEDKKAEASSEGEGSQNPPTSHQQNTRDNVRHDTPADEGSSSKLKVRPKQRPSTAIGGRSEGSSTPGSCINFSKLQQTLMGANGGHNSSNRSKVRPHTAIGGRGSESQSMRKFMTKRDMGNMMRQKKVNTPPLWDVEFKNDVKDHVETSVLNKAETHVKHIKKKVRPQTAFPNSLRPDVAKARAHFESPKILTMEKDVKEAKAPPKQNNGSEYLFSMPRPTPEPYDDGEKLPNPPPRYSDNKCGITRTDITLFHEESTNCAKDYTYKDTFKRSLSRLDSRYVGPKNKKYPKKPGPYNVPTHGTRLNEAYQLSEFRMLGSPLDLLSPLDVYKGVKDPWAELPRFD